MTKHVEYISGNGGYTLTNEELAHLIGLAGDLRTITTSGSDSTRATVGAGVAIYNYLLSLISFQAENNFGVLVPERHPKTGVEAEVFAWIEGAAKVNNGDGFFADFIREYTKIQFELRGGSAEAAELLNQESSNKIALALADDIIARVGALPGISGIGANDAGAAATTVFVQLPGAIGDEDFAPWAGALLFPFLGYDDLIRPLLLNEEQVVADIEGEPPGKTIKFVEGTYDLIASIQAARLAGSLASDMNENISNFFEALSSVIFPDVRDSDQSDLIQEATGFFNRYYGLNGSEGFAVGNDMVFNRVNEAFESALGAVTQYQIGIYGDDTAMIALQADKRTVMHSGDGNDQVSGSTKGDLIDGGNDNDHLRGLEGNDFLYGANGNDTLFGGSGEDKLKGGDNDDSLTGHGVDGVDDNARDDLEGGDGADTYSIGMLDRVLDTDRSAILNYKGIAISGTFTQVTNQLYRNTALGLDLLVIGTGAIISQTGNASDLGFTIVNFQDAIGSFVNGDFGISLQTAPPQSANIINGDAGNNNASNSNSEALIGGSGRDEIYGLAGTDELRGADGDDLLDGGDGKDIMRGDGGNDVLLGGAGLAFLAGGEGDDWLESADASDLLSGGRGRDVLKGGAGDDYLLGDSNLYAANVDATLTVSFPTRWGDLSLTYVSGAYSSLIGEQDEIFGGAGRDIILGEGGDDLLWGEEGDDAVQGGANNDELSGGIGNDYLLGDDPNDLIGGADTLRGDAGADLIVGKKGNDVLLGGDDDDELQGGDDTDVLQGGDGNDFLFGDKGNDVLQGEAGNDRLQGGTEDDGADTLDGGTGNDLLFGEAGNDHLLGGDGNDTMLGGLGNDTLNGGLGVDSLRGEDGNDYLSGGDGNDSLIGGNGDDSLNGGTGADSLWGDAGLDNLSGGEGNDLLQSGTGNDILYGDSGDDELQGGAEHDQLNGGVGADRLFGQDGNDTLYGGSENDQLQGGNNNDLLSGDAGNDSLWGENGNDSLYGGSGIDYLAGGAGTDHYYFKAGDGKKIITDAGTNVLHLEEFTFSQIRLQLGSWVFGSIVLGPLKIQLGENGDEIELSNFSEAESGITQVILQDGTYSFEQILSAGISFSGTPSNDSINGSPLVDKIDGGGGNDDLNGELGNDSVHGGEGNDDLDGGSGIDTLYGGLGDDNYYVDQEDDRVNEGANEGVDTVFVNGSFVRYSLQGQGNIERLVMAPGAYGHLIGNELNNEIIGGSDSDQLDGGLGADTMIGGAGSDLYVVDDAGDVVVELDTDEGSDVVESHTAEYTLPANVEDVRMVGASALVLTGNNLANNIFGNENDNSLYGLGGNDLFYDVYDGIGSSNDFMDGGDGNDTLHGDGGNDTLVGGAGTDELYGNGTLIGGDGDDYYYVDSYVDLYEVIIEDLNEGIDSVESSWDFTLPANVENLVLRNGAIGVGNDLANTLSGHHYSWWTVNLNGKGGDDHLIGDGNDTLIGGTGNDVFVITDSSETAVTVVENSNEGEDIIEARCSITLGDNVEHLKLTGLEMHQNGTGNQSDNKLIGNRHYNELRGESGNDTLDGGNGSDKLYGGDGNDSIHGGDDQWVLGLGQWGIFAEEHFGTDHPEGNIQSLHNHDLIEAGTGNDSVDGGSGNDTIRGQDGNDYLYGGLDGGYSAIDENGVALGPLYLTNNDSIEGGTGADTINGGSGDDFLVGGEGFDTYVFKAGDGIDTITDQGSNLLHFTDRLFNQLTISTTGGLILKINGTDDEVRLSAFDPLNPSAGAGVTSFKFADGSIRTLSEILGTGGTGNVTVINGGSGNNTLNGTTGNDLIRGLGGNDTINGLEGNDELIGGTDYDSLNGGAGDDVFVVEGTNHYSDTYDGGDGFDEIRGTAGNDDVILISFSAAMSVERINGLAGTNRILGTWHDNVLDFSTTELVGIASLYAGSGNDEIKGSAQANVIYGEDGADTIYANGGNDTIIGGLWHDLLYGGDGDDLFLAEGTGQGTDLFTGGDGIDEIRGTSGDDNFSISVFNGASTVERIDGLAGINRIVGTWDNNVFDFAATELVGITSIDGGSGNDDITGSTQADAIYGNTGVDTIHGGGGNDVIVGGEFRDTLYGDDGDDLFLVEGIGQGTDVFSGGNGTDEIRGTSGDDDFTFQLFSGASTVERIDGLGGINRIFGTYFENNVLDFSATQLVGIASIDGGSGNDVITGSTQADVIIGNTGQDTLSGGGGGDTYMFSSGAGYDVIQESANVSETDVIKMGTGIDKLDLWFTKQGNNLLIRQVGVLDQITVKDWYLHNGSEIERIEADGFFIEADDVEILATAMSAYTAPVGLSGVLTQEMLDGLASAYSSAWQTI